MTEFPTFEEGDLGLWSTILFNTSELVHHQKPRLDKMNLGLFATFPFEIREQIWQYFMPEHNLVHRGAPEKTYFRTAVSLSENERAIIRTSRQIHAEISKMLDKRRTLQVRIYPYFGRKYSNEKDTCQWAVECKNNRHCYDFSPDFFARFVRMRIDVWAGYERYWTHDERLRDCIIDLASVLTKSEKLSKLEIVIRHYELVHWNHKDLTQPNHVVSSDDDIRAMLGPILSLERLRDAVKVRSVLAVKHTKISHPTTVQFRRLGIALRTRLASERKKCRKVAGGFVGTRVQAGNEEDTVGAPVLGYADTLKTLESSSGRPDVAK